MRSFRISVSAFFVLLMVLGSAHLLADAHENCGSGHHMKGEECELDLTDKKKEKLHKLKIDHQKKMIDFSSKMKKLELGIKEEMLKDSPGKDAIMEHVDKMMDVKHNMKKARIEMIFDARKIMPEDKWKLFIRHHMKHGCHGKDERCEHGSRMKMGRKGRAGEKGKDGHCGMGLKEGCGK